MHLVNPARISMNPEDLRQRLVKAARTTADDDSVPPDFDRRVMRAILSSPAADPLAEWLSGLRWAASASAAIAAAALALHLVMPPASPDPTEPDALEAALLADVSSIMEESLLEESRP